MLSGIRALARASVFLGIILFAFAGCSSNRFQLANDPRNNDIPGIASTIPPRPGRRIQVPDAPPPLAQTEEIPPLGPPPGTPPGLGTLAQQEPSLRDNPNPNQTGVGNRIRQTETPRPGPPGSDLRMADDGPVLLGIVVNDVGQPEPLASIEVRDASRAGRVIALTAAGADGRFQVRNVLLGAQYQVNAATVIRGRRSTGSTTAVAPDTAVVVQVVPELKTTHSMLGTRLGSPGDPRDLPDSKTPDPVARTVAADGEAVRVRVPSKLPTQPAPLQANDPWNNVRPMRSDAPEPRSAPPQTAVGPDGVAWAPSANRPEPAAIPAAPLSAPVALAPALSATGLANDPLTTSQGQRFTLGQLQGEVILLDFFGSWCGPCRECVPKLNAFHQRYSAQGLQVVGIAAEEGDLAAAIVQAEQARQELAIRYPVIATSMDERNRVRDYFQVDRYPTLVLLDRSGRVLFRGVGGSAQVFHQLDAAIQQAISGRSLAQAP